MDTRIGDYVEQVKKIYTQSLFAESKDQKERIGTVRVLDDGRVFVYARNAGTALAAGKLCQAAAPVADHRNQLIKAAAAVGDKSVTVAIGATAVTRNQYQDGWLHINDVDGEGFVYKIRNHGAADANATDLVINLYDGIRKALVADSSQYTLTKNLYDSIIVAPTALTGAVVGVPPIDVTANYYFWLQVKGPCPVLTDGTIVVGAPVTPSGTTSGAVKAVAAVTNVVVGTVIQVNATTEYSLINLHLG